ncbi:peptidyl-prolyl isomerase CWC27-like protein [Acrodontium crateriforme]|uniref:Peptidyl-prolyl isomerase CWC27-like protein n=1 Tax=Acrodontium crateriforme TaxID=150365 RepID=A0AAQ3M9I2_9PEZI|nr:peptidyl-prolyl isomerase CWC27-like protein [Acrodontium crateriforme]
MASLYNLEPQPTAKVLLHTTAGSLTLELFAKQTPLASRNFLQHCLDGYYNNTIFHRLVPGFIIQGGDPTGTGSGGISAIENGQGFQDEIHSRLKFNRRGLLGMANEGKDSNGSQFFLTLGVTAELQGKHTMFGRVEGDTIYNLMKMGEAELVEGEGSERPLYPTMITGAEILVNPFDDMVARVKEAPRIKEDGGKKEVKKRKKPAGKNILSFGDEEEDEVMAAPIIKKAKANPKLVSMDEGSEITKAVKVKKARKERSPSPKDEIMVDRAVTSKPQAALIPQPESDEDEEPEQTSKRDKLLEKTNAEIAALKASMKRTVNIAPTQQEEPKSAIEAMIPTNSTKGRKRGKAADERGAMDLFKAFKSKLDDIAETESKADATNGHHAEEKPGHKASIVDEDPEGDEEAALCDLHFIANCQSCKSWDDNGADANADDGDEDGGAWMAHRLTFAKDTLGKDLEWKRKMEEIEVVDPREKARLIKEEGRRDKGKGKARA